MQHYQLSFEDIEKQKIVEKEPMRYAFIDECGGFGFDFSKDNTSKYFILGAVIAKKYEIDALSNSVDSLRRKFFSDNEMKSKTIGSNDKRRMALLTEILQLDFKVILLIADKEKFKEKSALTEYKKTFYKYMHKLLYNNLYLVYPKLKICADALGDNEFKEGFKKYVESNRPKYNIFNEYDFDFADSENSNLVQLADIIVGSISRSLIDTTAPNYQEILSGKISHIEYFPNFGKPNIVNQEDLSKFNDDIYNLSVRLADQYIDSNIKSIENEKRLRVGFLRILLFEVQNGNPFKFVTSYKILESLNEYVGFKVSKTYLYRQIVAPLRDEKILISSSPQGYKIPVSIDDIFSYIHQTHTIVSPMLHRVEICRDLIKERTGVLDVLDSEPFAKYKKYFD